MVTALGEMGHEVDLVVYPHGEELSIPGMTIHRVMSVPGVGKAPIGPSMAKLVYDYFLAFKLLWMCLTRRYDVIHAVEESAILAWKLRALFSAIPYIFDMDSHISDQLALQRVHEKLKRS